jgi:glycosyltransferase involved in cell wall biosynthesis
LENASGFGVRFVAHEAMGVGAGRPNEGKKALICFFDAYLGVAPSVVSTILQLVERGYQVDVILREISADFGAPPPLPKAVRVLRLSAPSNRLGWLKTLRGRAGKFANKALPAIDMLHFTLGAGKAALGRRYHAVFGIDMFGLIAAYCATKTANAGHLVYWSLEIHFLDELIDPVTRVAKQLENRISHKADLIVVQDDVRAAALAKATGVSMNRMIAVPNAPLGRPGKVEPEFLHSALNLRPETRIVLHAGMICDEAMSLDLARAAAKWREPYKLVFHERRRRDPAEPYLQALLESGAGRLALSLTPQPLDRVDSVFASAFVGLAFYSDAFGPNFSQIGTASGKLAFFLRNGVPVVVNSLPGLARLVDKTRCGIAVAAADDVFSAVERIAEDYEGFRRRARACFDGHFDFRPFFDDALQRLGEK